MQAATPSSSFSDACPKKCPALPLLIFLLFFPKARLERVSAAVAKRRGELDEADEAAAEAEAAVGAAGEAAEDVAPLRRLREAVSALVTESRGLDLRAGVLSAELFRRQLTRFKPQSPGAPEGF